MRIIRGIIKSLFFVCLFVTAAIFALVIYLGATVGDEYKVIRGESLHIDTPIPVTAVYNGSSMSGANVNMPAGQRMQVELKMFGAIPFSVAEVQVVDEVYVAVLGNPFGIRLYTEGVLVVDMTSVKGNAGEVNPAAEAGLKVGDYIITANGLEVNCNEDIAEIVSDSAGRKIKLKIKRDGREKSVTVYPVLSKETGNYQLGIWVRDSTAGIGTLTFYSPATGIICGLGHGICDSDTGALLSVESGQMVTAGISAIVKGESGAPGELKGSFKNEVLAPIRLNSDIGIYGELTGSISISTLTEVALKSEVKNGKAQILCTVDGDEPQLYSCTVKKRSVSEHSKTQNLTVTITDRELLKKTGGIVQGLSGSPIIQNGKLIGAVTHV